ncbi:MAG: small acid-soluble spore protein SspI [Bacilli bacterium]|nr:small acid-soluble spore protein SspI [Bacilli bacterium]
MNIRNHIRKNFKDADIDEFKSSIIESIKEQDEITLPGLGVFFEILWNNSDENSKEYILNTIKDHI